MITFACPGCAQRLAVPDDLAGKKARCSRCGQVASVPQVRVTPGSPPGDAIPPTEGSEAVGLALNQPSGSFSTQIPPHQVQDTREDPRPGAVPQPQAPVLTPDLSALLTPPQSRDELGRLGPYRVLQVLGRGGMGVVFRAEDPHLERPVALKAMLRALGDSDTARQRFLREARTAASLKHDHIVTIYQVGDDRGVPFLAMELLEGESLEDRLRGQGPLPLPETLRIGRQIAEGLDAAHQRGLIHRDIKPGNIWLEAPRGRVKILDFGLARAAQDQAHLTHEGAVVGTPAYMAPEQASGASLDARCDLFSLGCVLYRLCTGELPFRGHDPLSTLLAVINHQPPPPCARTPDVPPALSDLIMRLLAKDPSQRPASARAVVEALEALQRGLEPTTPDRVPPAGPEDRTLSSPALLSPWRGRRRLTAVALSLLLAGGLLAGGIVILIKDRQGRAVRIEVPEGSTVQVQQNNKVVGEFPRPVPKEERSPTGEGWKTLFDGKDLSGWVTLTGAPATWEVEDGYVEVVPGRGDIRTREAFGPDFQLHAEFWVPLMPGKSGQARGNSGIYLQGRYEVQVLDSFENPQPPERACGALYGILGPSRNVSKPPEEWQTFDMTFHAPRVDGRGEVAEPGRLTLIHNGSTVIDEGRFDRPTLGARDRNMGAPGPIVLQEHGAAVRFRNIRIRPLH